VYFLRPQSHNGAIFRKNWVADNLIGYRLPLTASCLGILCLGILRQGILWQLWQFCLPFRMPFCIHLDGIPKIGILQDAIFGLLDEGLGNLWEVEGN